jgi:hypothetical protein
MHHARRIQFSAQLYHLFDLIHIKRASAVCVYSRFGGLPKPKLFCGTDSTFQKLITSFSSTHPETIQANHQVWMMFLHIAQKKSFSKKSVSTRFFLEMKTFLQHMGGVGRKAVDGSMTTLAYFDQHHFIYCLGSTEYNETNHKDMKKLEKHIVRFETAGPNGCFDRRTTETLSIWYPIVPKFA